MQRLIGAELLLVLLVFALAAAWRFTPPPRALAAQSPAPVSVHLHVPQAMVDLTLTPQRDRRLSANLFMRNGERGALDAQEVSLQFSNRALRIEPLQRDAHRGADSGAWLVEAFALPAPGRWHVRIEVLISDFERVELEKDIDIAF
jgi:copper transport protein